MLGRLANKLDFGETISQIPAYLTRPVRLIRTYDRSDLQPDLLAGLTVAVILLPQAIAFALIAELPPQMGLYAAVVAAIVGGLWGSSNHISTGPTNAISLLVISSLLTATSKNSGEFVIAASLLAVMAGFMQLVLGLGRLGILVNFVSHSVIVGFSTGAGILIAVKQIKPLLGLEFEAESIADTLLGIIRHAPETHEATAAIGVGVIVLIVILRRINRRLPTALISMIAAGVAVAVLQLHENGVAVIGSLPTGLPPLSDIGAFTPDLVARLSTGALAIGAIGLVETAAISRSIATQTGQRLDSNQEFVGQGLANFVTGLFTGYPVAGSFSRSAVNFRAGAKSPMAGVFTGTFVLVAMLLLGPLTAFLPRSALAGVLIITAYGLLDFNELRRIWRGTTGDAVIMLITLLGTLFLHIDDAVIMGILLSFAVYVMRTSTPRVHAVVPDNAFEHFAYQPDKPQCPQLGIVDIQGDLYFGAVNHVEEQILRQRDEHPGQRFLLIRMGSVTQCDFSGIHMLENLLRIYRDAGGDIFLVRVQYQVAKIMKTTGFDKHLGAQNFLDQDVAISHLFSRVLDPATCIYECDVRVFRECQSLPKRQMETLIPIAALSGQEQFATIPARELWELVRGAEGAPDGAPLVIDVREPREYRQGHITTAQLIPLPRFLDSPPDIPPNTTVVLACRTGRRSRLAARALQARGQQNIRVLEDGMVAWEAAGLLEVVEWLPAALEDLAETGD